MQNTKRKAKSELRNMGKNQRTEKCGPKYRCFYLTNKEGGSGRSYKQKESHMGQGEHKRQIHGNEIKTEEHYQSREPGKYKGNITVVFKHALISLHSKLHLHLPFTFCIDGFGSVCQTSLHFF